MEETMKLKKVQTVAAFVAAFGVVAAGTVSTKFSAPSRRVTAGAQQSVAHVLATTVTDTAFRSAKAVANVATTVGSGVSAGVVTVAQAIAPLPSLFSSEVPFGSI